ncbi:hypothetical protein AB0O34_27825 [Sphaerisporangium sp. NPDC088356]|uniref:hypothetical protein n=1 Tax=Sphaerisporangium sp. NPDC088356 TaxID=3154871 RepID=UPI00341603A0
MGLTRWVRARSEHYLMVDAQDRVGTRLGGRRPHPPRGGEIFWRRVYVPIFHRLPLKLRSSIIARMPGSHQQAWTPQPPSKGPAI